MSGCFKARSSLLVIPGRLMSDPDAFYHLRAAVQLRRRTCSKSRGSCLPHRAPAFSGDRTGSRTFLVVPRESKQPAAAPVLHASAVLPADFEQCVGDLAERARAHGVYQFGEHVAVVDHGLLQFLQRSRRLGGVALLELAQPAYLVALFFIGRTLQRDAAAGLDRVRIAEGVHAD